MAQLPRGIQAVAWTNADGSKSMRYRVRIVRKDFKADNLYSELSEAAQFLTLSKTESGRAMLAASEKRKIEEKEAELSEALNQRLFLHSIELHRQEHIDTLPDKEELDKRKKNNMLSFIRTIIKTHIDRPTKSVSTQLFEEQQIPTENVPLWGIPVAELRPNDINCYIKARQKKGKKSSTISREVSIISQIFETERLVNPAIEEKLNPALLYNKKLLKNPQKIEDGKTPVKKRKRLGDREEQIFKALREYSNPQMLQIVEFALATSMRRSEIINLRWDTINKDEFVIDLSRAKAGARPVYLTEQAIQILDKVEKVEGEPRVFFSYSSIGGFEGSFVKLIKDKLGIYDVSFHTFRKEAISRFIDNLGEENAPIVAKFLGISNVRKFEENYIESKPSDLTTYEGIRRSIGHKSKEVTNKHYYEPQLKKSEK